MLDLKGLHVCAEIFDGLGRLSERDDVLRALAELREMRERAAYEGHTKECFDTSRVRGCSCFATARRDELRKQLDAAGAAEGATDGK